MSEQRRKPQSSTPSDHARESHDHHDLGEKGKKLGGELDALLDEIDGVLEENAAEFVRDYVQHGGQ